VSNIFCKDIKVHWSFSKGNRKLECSRRSIWIFHKHYFLLFCRNDQSYWWLVFGAVLLLTAWSRFHKVSEPDHVWW